MKVVLSQAMGIKCAAYCISRPSGLRSILGAAAARIAAGAARRACSAAMRSTVAIALAPGSVCWLSQCGRGLMPLEPGGEQGGAAKVVAGVDCRAGVGFPACPCRLPLGPSLKTCRMPSS